MSEKTGENKRSYKKLFYVTAILFILMIIFAVTHIRADIPLEELLDDYAGESSSFLEIDGGSIHYRDEGSGEPLLLIHGWASSLHTWDDWAEILKEDFRVIRLDLPGFGLTGPVKDAVYSTEYFAKVVTELLDELNIQKTHIAGSSMGGRVAAYFAGNYPERTNRLILLNAAGYITESSGTPGLFSAEIVSFLARHITPRYIMRIVMKGVVADGDKVTEEIVTRYQKMLLREGNRSIIFSVLGNSDVGLSSDKEREKLKNLAPPTLIMWGDKDRWVPPEHAYLYKEDIPGSRLIMYDGVGHIPMEEIPVKSALDAADFLSEGEPDISDIYFIPSP